MEASLRKLIGKFGLLCLPLVLLYFAGYAIEHGTQWKAVQNPRTAILWGGQYDGSKIVILGASTVNSARTHSDDQALWSRLAALSGQPVFPGSLDGAQTTDVLYQAKVVAKSWPAGTTVFVDVAPTKFVPKTKTSTTDSGNWEGRFANLVQIDNPKHKPSVYLSNFLQPVASAFFLFRNLNETGIYLKSLVTGEGWPGLANNRAWTSDALAQQLYERFTQSLQGNYLEPRERYFLGVQSILGERGIRPVFVLTGLNKTLIRQYGQNGGQEMIAMFEKNRADLKAYLESQHLLYLDLTDAIPSVCYADMVHANACGDQAMAENMNQWLLSHRLDSQAQY